MATARKLNKNLLHIEAEGCVINIREGLHTHLTGQKVTSIEILPDDHYIGERIWRTVPKICNIRVIQGIGKLKAS